MTLSELEYELQLPGYCPQGHCSDGYTDGQLHGAGRSELAAGKGQFTEHWSGDSRGAETSDGCGRVWTNHINAALQTTGIEESTARYTLYITTGIFLVSKKHRLMHWCVQSLIILHRVNKDNRD